MLRAMATATSEKISKKAPEQEERKSESLEQTLERLRAAHRRLGPPTYTQRMERLEKLEKVLARRKDDIARAISKDFGHRSRHETLVAEVFISLMHIRYIKERLHEWMEPEPREVSWLFAPGRAEVVYQPLGVVGIIAPWNYPFQLAAAPLVSAIAAGNHVMIKPSELTPHTADMIEQCAHEALPDDVCAVIKGGVDVSEAFSKLPFDHLLFTGSTRVGRLVMRAASENLVPVTLELGGKSPAIVGEDFKIEQAAERIMAGKLFNAGQTCIAPDYVLLPKGKVDAFVSAAKHVVERMYPTLEKNPDYTSIINEHHWERLRRMLEEAKRLGAKIVEINPANEELGKDTHKLAPTLVLEPSDDLSVMQEEIFGPILPIRTYENLDKAIDSIGARPRPLALYYFGHDATRIDKVLTHTISGGVCVNDTMLHFAQDDLPFGGVGASGMGHYHGKEGFETFSKKKPVFYQSRINGAALLRPPYGKTIDFALRFLLGKD
jgi:coniferyl-aldehyde dehydrogenase